MSKGVIEEIVDLAIARAEAAEAASLRWQEECKTQRDAAIAAKALLAEPSELQQRVLKAESVAAELREGLRRYETEVQRLLESDIYQVRVAVAVGDKLVSVCGDKEGVDAATKLLRLGAISASEIERLRERVNQLRNALDTILDYAEEPFSSVPPDEVRDARMVWDETQ